MVVVFVVKAFDGRLLVGAVHSFCLAIGPCVVELAQSVLDFICLTDHFEAHLPGIGCVTLVGLVGAPNDIIGHDCSDPACDGFVRGTLLEAG